MPGLDDTRQRGTRPTRTASTLVDTAPGADLPARADRHLLLQPVRQHGQAARLLRRDDLRPDRQVVGHGRRALVRVRPRHVRHVPGAARPAGGKRPRCERPDEPEHGQRHDLQVRDPVPVHSRRDGVCALQRGLPPRRREFAARGRHRAGAGHLRAGLPERTTSSASRASGSTTGCCSMSPPSSWSGTTSSSVSTSTSDGDDGAWWLEGNINGGKAEQKGVEFNGQWYATDRLNFEWSAFLASPEFTEDTFVPNTDEVYIAEGTDDAGLAQGEVLGRGRVHVPGFPAAAGRPVDAVLVHLAGRGLGQPRPRSRTSTTPRPRRSGRARWNS